MSEADLITLPNFLIPYKDGVEYFTDDAETVGKIVIAVATKIFKGADISPKLSPCERGVYRQWLKVAEEGIEKASRERRKVQNAAAARWSKSKDGTPQARPANPSQSGGRSPAPVRQIEPAQGKPPAPTPAPVRRTAAQPSGGARRGGCTRLGDGLNFEKILDGGDDGIETMIFKNPVKAALQITGETGNAKAENTLKKYVRTKGADNCAQTLYEFYAELKQGEEPDNRGKALNARLKALPDIPAQERGRGRE